MHGWRLGKGLYIFTVVFRDCRNMGEGTSQIKIGNG